MKLLGVNLLFAAVGILFSNSLSAASITQYRLVLDEENRTREFLLTNNTQYQENCDLSFSNQRYNLDSTSLLQLSDEQEAALNDDVLSLVRYSPKKVSIGSGEVQKVKFSMRRTISDTAREIRTYLNVRCVNNKPREGDGFQITPAMVHRLPLIARVGDLDAAVNIEDVYKSSETEIKVKLSRTGERSVIGKLYVFKPSDDTTNLRNAFKFVSGVIIYPESNEKTFDIKGIVSSNFDSLVFVFKEESQYGGEIESKKLVQVSDFKSL
jgi:hypothetical protein